MLLLLGLLLAAGFVVFAAALFKPSRLVDTLLAYYILGTASIILVAEVLSLLNLLNRPAAFLTGQTLLAAGAGFTWWRAGRPRLLPRFARPAWNPRGVWQAIKTWPDLFLLAGGVTAAYAISARLNWSMPPNTNDSMHTHMSRVGYWLQHGSFAPWATPYTWQTIYPLNAQTQILWTALLWGSDQLVEFVQWTAVFAAMLAIFGLARLLGGSRPQAAFAALIFATFPEVILQSTTTQNDLIVAALFTISMYFLYAAIIGQRRGLYLLSALGLGLSIGTKQTVVFILPGLALALVLILAYRKVRFNDLVVWSAAGLAAALLVGSYMYTSNLVRFGNPLGPREVVAQNSGTASGESLVQRTVLSTVRLLYQGADLTGMPKRAANIAQPLKVRVAQAVSDLLNIPIEAGYTANGHTFDLARETAIQEDEGWYGPVGFALLTLMLGWAVIQGLRKQDPFRLGLVIMAVVYLLCTAAFRPGWDPYQGRYFLISVTLTAALMAFFAVPSLAGFLGRVVVIALALVVMQKVVFYNTGKPIVLEPKNQIVASGDRIDKITLQGWFMVQVLRMVDERVPADATLGLYTFQGYWDYPLFGEHFTRTIIPIYPYERIGDEAWLREQGIEYLLVNTSKGEPGNVPSCAEMIGHLSIWNLYRFP